MAHLNNFKNHKFQPTTLQMIGQKVKHAAELSQWLKALGTLAEQFMKQKSNCSNSWKYCHSINLIEY